MPEEKTRVLIVRGHLATPWELRPWEKLPDRFDVSFLVSPRNRYDLDGIRLSSVPARALSDFLPPGRLGALMSGLTGDRYLGADDAFAAIDIVHAEELSFWFAADAAARKARHGFKLVLTVWETIPFLETFRNRQARVHRRRALAATDLFLPTTERARDALLLEGVEEERIEVLYPGTDIERFTEAAAEAPRVDEHVIVSPGRLVWEKGHQDVMRALAALRRGIVPDRTESRPRLLVIGSGPEEGRLRAYAGELGISDVVEIRSVPYDEMPATFARASCMVLASLPHAGGGYVLGDIPRFFWEEQFGLVLIEAMASGLPIIASRSGAIPEVVGEGGTFFEPGDWRGLAEELSAGPLGRPPGKRVAHPPVLARYSLDAQATRLAAAYDRVLSTRS